MVQITLVGSQTEPANNLTALLTYVLKPPSKKTLQYSVN